MHASMNRHMQQMDFASMYANTHTHTDFTCVYGFELHRQRERWIDANNDKGISGDVDTHTTEIVAWLQNTETNGCVQVWIDGCTQLQTNQWIQTHTHTHTHAHTRFQTQRQMDACKHG